MKVHNTMSLEVEAMPVRPLLVQALVFVGLALPLAAQWSRLSPTSSPSPRAGHVMAYDAARQRIVLFAGSGRADTWVWTGTRWRERFPMSSPSIQSSPKMVYHVDRQRVMVVARSINGAMSTWEWTGSEWFQVRALGLTPRDLHALAYDPIRRRIVVFGGVFGSALGDTWEFDGTSWRTVRTTNSPPARYGAAMAFDHGSGRILMFGGFDGANVFGDTWTYDGTDWRRETPTVSPPANFFQAIVADSVRDTIFLYGGFVPGSTDTWGWRNGAWSKLASPTSPPGHAGAAMAFDPTTGRLILFGGLSGGVYRDGTWAWGERPTAGEFSPYGRTCGLTLSAVRPPSLGKPFELVVTNLGSTTMGVLGAGVSREFIGPLPLPLPLDSLGMPGCFLNQSHETTFAFPARNGTGRVQIQIPLTIRYLGAFAYLQAFAGAQSSNGAKIVIGNQ